jgi:hypothetical protein
MDDNEVPLTIIAEFAARLDGEAMHASTEAKRCMGKGCKPKHRRKRAAFVQRRRRSR